MIGTNEYPPYVSKSLKNLGLVPSILTKVFKDAGFKVEYKYFPWKRCEMLLLKGITPEIYYGFGESKEPKDRLTDNNRGNVPSLTEFLASKTVGSEDDKAAEKEEDVEYEPKKESSRRLSDYFRI